MTAYTWIDLFASRSTGEDPDRTVEARDIVEEVLTAEQRVEAQRLAREWDEAHPRD